MRYAGEMEHIISKDGHLCQKFTKILPLFYAGVLVKFRTKTKTCYLQENEPFVWSQKICTETVDNLKLFCQIFRTAHFNCELMHLRKFFEKVNDLCNQHLV